MLAKPQRLRADRKVRSVLRSGEKSRGRFLTIRTRNTGAENNQFAFVISRSTAKRAVDRNRLRRRLREIAQRLPNKHRAVVVIAHPGAVTQSQNELQTEFTKLFSPQRYAPTHRTRH